MLPQIEGKIGLDIGCGEGSNTRKLAQLGANMVGIDIASAFINAARMAENSDPLGIEYHIGDASQLPFNDGSFDFASSFMCMMDVPDQPGAVSEAFRIIRHGGFFQFSILHPCFSPNTHSNIRDSSGKVCAVQLADCFQLADYFVENDGSIEEWTFGGAKRAGEYIPAPFKTPRFHRTLSNWLNLLINTGFTIEELGEPTTTPEHAKRYPELADTMVVPLFLHIKARKN